MKELVKIPYGVASFEKMRNQNYYLVDKTAFINDLEEYKVPIFLRPRRFGKSLWCSTLECYYDINRTDRFETLFGDLAIGKKPTGNQNRYMVLRLDFSKISASTHIEELESNFQKEILSSFSRFLGHYENFFGSSFTIDENSNAATTLSLLLNHCIKNNFPPIYVIIDEYDNFSNQFVTIHRDDIYKTLTTGDSFFKTFFKVLKAGIGEQSIAHVFITGVLPITMDDLTSGFNIAEFITLKKQFHDMLGFTQSEVETYLNTIFETYNFNKSSLPITIDLVRRYYNGYRFTPDVQTTLYNSTILTYFIKNYIECGDIPSEMIDSNIKTDISWIELICGSNAKALRYIENLLIGESVPYDESMLSSKFNMHEFFEENFFAISLFYLGMLTVESEFDMCFPNQTLKKIFAGYYNTLSKIEVSQGYNDYFKQFLKEGNLEALFAGYYTTYLGQVPAQAFDKINENFIRTTFFELCTRYLSRHFTFAIEVNHPSGRSDWEMLGRPDSRFKDELSLLEFKYFTRADQKVFDAITAPYEKDVEQVNAYAEDTLRKFPKYRIRKYLCYVCGSSGFRWFEV